MKEFPRKFLSLRDKSGEHHRSKSAPPANKVNLFLPTYHLPTHAPDAHKASHTDPVVVEQCPSSSLQSIT